MGERPKIPKPALLPEEAANRITSETMERQLIFGIMRSYIFYTEVRDIVCPYDPVTVSYRPDFTVARYNILYKALDAYWRYYVSEPPVGDLTASPEGVLAYIVDWTNNKELDSPTCTKLEAEVPAEAALADQITLESSRSLVRNPGFKTWLEQRMLVNEFKRLSALKEAGNLTLVDFKNRVAAIDFNAGYKSNCIDGDVLLRERRTITKCWQCGIQEIDEAAGGKGGGFSLGEAWMGAALTGCGKTILANQLLWAFASTGANVLLVTTEQKPKVLVPRVVSNYTSTPFDRFIVDVDPRKMDFSDIEKTQTIPYIPDYLWTDNRTAAAMVTLQKVFAEKIKYADWTGGEKKIIQRHLKLEVETLRKERNWRPHVIVFDWLGGALAGTEDPKTVRFMFKAGADYFADYCQNEGYLGIMFSQLAQSLALNKKVVHISMLAEAKNIVDKFDGFLGISGMHEQDKNIEEFTVSKPRLLRSQYIHVGKARNGPGGLCSVAQEFLFQRFGPRRKNNNNMGEL